MATISKTVEYEEEDGFLYAQWTIRGYASAEYEYTYEPQTRWDPSYEDVEIAGSTEVVITDVESRITGNEYDESVLSDKAVAAFTDYIQTKLNEEAEKADFSDVAMERAEAEAEAYHEFLEEQRRFENE